MLKVLFWWEKFWVSVCPYLCLCPIAGGAVHRASLDIKLSSPIRLELFCFICLMVLLSCLCLWLFCWIPFLFPLMGGKVFCSWLGIGLYRMFAGVFFLFLLLPCSTFLLGGSHWNSGCVSGSSITSSSVLLTGTMWLSTGTLAAALFFLLGKSFFLRLALFGLRVGFTFCGGLFVSSYLSLHWSWFLVCHCLGDNQLVQIYIGILS